MAVSIRQRQRSPRCIGGKALALGLVEASLGQALGAPSNIAGQSAGGLFSNTTGNFNTATTESSVPAHPAPPLSLVSAGKK